MPNDLGNITHPFPTLAQWKKTCSPSFSALYQFQAGRDVMELWTVNSYIIFIHYNYACVWYNLFLTVIVFTNLTIRPSWQCGNDASYWRVIDAPTWGSFWRPWKTWRRVRVEMQGTFNMCKKRTAFIKFSQTSVDQHRWKLGTLQPRGGTAVYQGYAGVRQKSPCSDKNLP